jgi:outer membrane protein OmpU
LQTCIIFVIKIVKIMLTLESIPRKEPLITHSCRGSYVGMETESYNPRERIMKKVFLTTTALVMTAGVAAAEVSFSGTGQVSYGAVGGADMALNTHLDVNVAVSGAADNGVTFATTFGYDAGSQADYNDDFTIDADEGGVWSAAAPEVAIGMNGWTITAQNAGIADRYDGDVDSGDIGIDGSIGGITLGVTTGTANGASSFSVGYSAGDMTVSLNSTTDDNGATAGEDAAMSMSIGYTIGDATITAATDNEGAAETTNSVGISYAMGALTVGYTLAGDNGANMGDDYDLSIGYTAGALSASFATNEENRTRMIAEYDLGGATAFFSSQQGGAAGTDLQVMGVNFAF